MSEKNNSLTNLCELVQLIKTLRLSESEGCAWTKQQNFSSLSNHTLEEAYEIVDAIEQGDPNALCAELGDMLYHVIFYAQIAEEQGLFNLNSVAQTMLKKHEERRPKNSHVMDAVSVNLHWQSRKKALLETKPQPSTGLLDDITPHLPALIRAAKLQERAACVGFDWTSLSPVINKIQEEWDELQHELQPILGSDTRKIMLSANQKMRITEELGDLLFTCVNLARHLEIAPEIALRNTNQKFIRRFRSVEKEAEKQGRSLDSFSLEEMDAIWNQSKDEELT